MRSLKSSRAPVIVLKPVPFWGFWLGRCLFISVSAIIVRNEEGKHVGDGKSREKSLEITVM